MDIDYVADASRHENNDFDDIFGSAPSSPALSQDSRANNSGHFPRIERREAEYGNLEPSDIPRLREKHQTEGYRDGITIGKTQCIQAGFDEGYSLGAVLGLRIGKVIGLLEGIATAVSSAPSAASRDVQDSNAPWNSESRRLGALLDDATEEMKPQEVFGAEYFGEDGIWKFAIPEEGGQQEVVFLDVAAAHPLVQKWEKIAAKEATKWGLDLNVIDAVHDTELIDTEAQVKRSIPTEADPHALKQKLDW